MVTPRALLIICFWLALPSAMLSKSIMIPHSDEKMPGVMNIQDTLTQPEEDNTQDYFEGDLDIPMEEITAEYGPIFTETSLNVRLVVIMTLIPKLRQPWHAVELYTFRGIAKELHCACL